ncbi:hypothetical protein EG829_15005 [bacterium]|nr:hypothetical protein [bacterium]
MPLDRIAPHLNRIHDEITHRPVDDSEPDYYIYPLPENPDDPRPDPIPMYYDPDPNLLPDTFPADHPWRHPPKEPPTTWFGKPLYPGRKKKPPG